MRTIYKYLLDTPANPQKELVINSPDGLSSYKDQEILIPRGFRILCLGVVRLDVYIYVELDNMIAKKSVLRLITVGTGQQIPNEHYGELTYLDSWVLGRLVGHVYYQIEE